MLANRQQACVNMPDPDLERLARRPLLCPQGGGCAHAHAACTCSAPLSAVGLVAVAPAGRPRRLRWRPLRRSPPPVAPVLAVCARQAPHRRSHDRGTMRRLRRAKVLGRPVRRPRGRRRAHSAGRCHARRRRGPPLRRRQTVDGGHAHVCAVWRRPRRRCACMLRWAAGRPRRAPAAPCRAGAGALSRGLEQGVRSGRGPACCTLLTWLDRQAHKHSIAIPYPVQVVERPCKV